MKLIVREDVVESPCAPIGVRPAAHIHGRCMRVDASFEMGESWSWLSNVCTTGLSARVTVDGSVGCFHSSYVVYVLAV